MASDGTPVAGARVRALRQHRWGGNRDPLAEATSGDDGTFLLTGLTAGQRADLLADAEGFGPEALYDVEAPATDVELVLERGAVLAGVVVAASGEPLEGVFLNLAPPAMVRPHTWHLRRFGRVSDDDGRFELTDLPAGELELRLDGPVTPTRIPFDLEPGEERRDLRIQVEGAAREVRLSGRVTDPGGEPVSGAEVRLNATYARGGYSSGTQTRPDGRFELRTKADEGTAAGTAWELVVDHPGYLEERRRLDLGGGAAELATVADERLEIVLREGGTTVGGTVAGADGTPLAAATVVLEPADGEDHAISSRRDVSAVSAPDGSFLLQGVEPGAWRLSAQHPDWIDGGPAEPVTVGTSPLTGLRLTLERGAVVRGRITGVDPRLLSTVRVTASHSGGGTHHSLSGQPDYTGEFRLAGARPGRWWVRAELSGDGRSAYETVEVGPGDTEVEVDLELGGGFELRGTLSVNGSPRSGTRLSLMREGTALMATTGRGGRFRFTDVSPGEYRLIASGLSLGRRITVRGDDDIQVEVRSALVAGRVVDEEGRPVEATVTLIPIGAANDAQRQSQSGRTRFRFEVEPGSYGLRATAAGYMTREVEVQAGPTAPLDDLELVLRRGDAAVLDLVTGGGPPPVRVLVAVTRGPGGEQPGGWHTVSPEGRLRFTGLLPGTSRILVSAPGRATVAADVEVPGAPVAVALPAAARLRVEVPSLAGIRAYVHVLDGGGQPVATLDLAGSVANRWRLADGSTEIDGLPPGRWAVEVRIQNRTVHRLPVALTGGTTVEVNLP